MPSCVVIGCKNHSNRFSKKDGVTYHRFPAHPARHQTWVRLIELQRQFKPQKNTRICSSHFSNDDFEYSQTGIRKLKQNAVPKIEIPNCDSNQSQQHELVNSQFDARVPRVSGETEAGRGRQHVGYRCNICRKHIFGFRYACVECTNFDMCSACEARALHAAHYVLRVPGNKQHVEAQAVLQNIRNVLKRDVYYSWEPELKIGQKEQCAEQDPLDAPTHEDSGDDSDQDGKSKSKSIATSTQTHGKRKNTLEAPVVVTIKAEPPHEDRRETSHTAVKGECERQQERKRLGTSAGSDGPSLKISRTEAAAGRGESEGFVVFTHQHKLPQLAPGGPPRKTLVSRIGQSQAQQSKLNQSSMKTRNLAQTIVASTDPQPLSKNQQTSILFQKLSEPSILHHRPFEPTVLVHKSRSSILVHKFSKSSTLVKKPTELSTLDLHTSDGL